MNLYWFPKDDPTRSTWTALTPAIDFPSDWGQGLAITTYDGVPGIETGTEVVLHIIPHVFGKGGVESVVCLEIWKVPSKPEFKFTKTEDLMGTDAKVLLLSKAIDIAIEPRDLPAALILFGAATKGIRRNTGRTQKVANFAIVKMEKRVAAFVLEALQHPISTFASFAGDSQKEDSFVASLSARLTALHQHTNAVIAHLFNRAFDACIIFDDPPNDLRDRPAADLYFQVLSRTCGVDSMFCYNAGLNAKNRMKELMDANTEKMKTRVRELMKKDSKNTTSRMEELVGANSDCGKSQCEAARWWKKAEKYWWEFAKRLEQTSPPKFEDLVHLNYAFACLYTSDNCLVLENGPRGRIIGSHMQREKQVSRATNLMMQIMKVHFPGRSITPDTIFQYGVVFSSEKESASESEARRDKAFTWMGAVRTRKCDVCGKEGTELKKCGQCKNREYCSVECQKVDWKTHKELCKAKKEARRKLVKQHRGDA